MSYEHKTDNNLKACRINAGYTQKEVCKLIGLASENRLSEWENGISVPNITNLFKLAYLYKVEPQKLYSEGYAELRNIIKKKERIISVCDCSTKTAI